MADIIITPASSIMSFTSSLNYKQTLTQDASGSLILQGSGSTGRTDIFAINGNAGTLFSVSDDLSNSLFSVNTIAGLPVIEAFADNTVVLGKYGQNDLVVTGSKVGIGTATPTTKLHTVFNDNAYGVTATFENSNAGSTAAASISLKNVSQGAFSLFQLNSSGDAGLYNTSTGGKINFFTNSSQRMTINASGDVGIGTSSPSYLLDVNGTVGVAANIIDSVSSKFGWDPNGYFLYAGNYSDPNSNFSGYKIEAGIASVTDYGEIKMNWPGQTRYNGQVLASHESGMAITAGMLVFLRSNNTWQPADRILPSSSTPLLGIALNSTGGAGQTLHVLLDGIIITTQHENNGTAITGAPLYVGGGAQGTTGYVDEFATNITGEVVRLVGHNIYDLGGSGVIIRFQPDNTWIEI